MVNQSKLPSNRQWRAWRAAGAVGTLEDAVKERARLEHKNKYIATLRESTTLTEAEIQELAWLDFKERVTGLKTHIRWFYLREKQKNPSLAEQMRTQAASLLEAGIHTEHEVIQLCLGLEKYGVPIQLRMGWDLYQVDQGLVYRNCHLTLESQIQRSCLQLKSTGPEIAERMLRETGELLSKGIHSRREAVAIGLLLANYPVAAVYNYKVRKLLYKVSEGQVFEDGEPILRSQIRRYCAQLRSNGRTELIGPMERELEPVLEREDFTDAGMEQLCSVLDKYVSGFVLCHDGKSYSFSGGRMISV